MAELGKIPKPPVPLIGPDGKAVLVVTHADAIIDGVNRYNPKFFGEITLNGVTVLKTSGGSGDPNDPDNPPKVDPMDPSTGGTGYDNLADLAKEVARLLGISEDTSNGENGSAGSAGSQIVIPITKGGTGKKTATEALAALGGTSAVLFQVTVNNSWSGSASAGYNKSITVTGMQSTDVPIVGVILSADKNSATTQGQAFACVSRIETSNNQITLYCYNGQPTSQFTIQLLTIRGFATGATVSG